MLSEQEQVGASGLVSSVISGKQRVSAEVKVYPQDVRVERHPNLPQSKAGGPRGAITRFSDRSRRRLAFSARNVPRNSLKVLLTLTYPEEYPTDGRRVKAHWIKLRKWLCRQGAAGLWFLEFQRRGAPHFHVFLTCPLDKKAVARKWYEIVGSSDERHLRAGTRIEAVRSQDGAGRYATKYAMKPFQKAVPSEYLNVGRFWGLFGGLRVEELGGSVGQIEEVATAIRFVRRVDRARRRARGERCRRDGGYRGWTGYGLGPIVGQWLEEVLWRGGDC